MQEALDLDEYAKYLAPSPGANEQTKRGHVRNIKKIMGCFEITSDLPINDDLFMPRLLCAIWKKHTFFSDLTGRAQEIKRMGDLRLRVQNE